VKLTPPQSKIAKDNHRFKVLCCGRRFGKTTLAVWELVGRAGLHPKYKAAYIAPTYQQARDIAWNELKQIVQGIAQEINESRLEIILKNGSHIVLRGWESVETLRGQAFDFLVVDEIAMMHKWDYNWSEVLRPTLTDRKGQAMFISTPRGFNHFYKLFNKQDTDYKSYHFTSYDNPYLPKEEIEKAKQELTEQAFAQEYLAEFRTAVGLAHKEWNRDIHVIKPFEVPRDWNRARGFDYGSTHPTARVRCALMEDGNEITWFIERTYKMSGMAIEDHATAIKTQDYGFKFMPSFGDPSGAQWFTEFSRYGLHIQPATREGSKGWVELGVEKINQMLRPRSGYVMHLPDGRELRNPPQLMVLDTPENQQFIQEIETLQWKETNAGETLPILDESTDSAGHYDLMAAFRYLVVSYQGMKKSWAASRAQQVTDKYGNPIV